MNRRDLARIWLSHAGNVERALIIAAQDFLEASSAAYLRTKYFNGGGGSHKQRHSIDDDEEWLRTGAVNESVEAGPD